LTFSTDGGGRAATTPSASSGRNAREPVPAPLNAALLLAARGVLPRSIGPPLPKKMTVAPLGPTPGRGGVEISFAQTIFMTQAQRMAFGIPKNSSPGRIAARKNGHAKRRVAANGDSFILKEELTALEKFDGALLANAIGYIDSTPPHEYYMGG